MKKFLLKSLIILICLLGASAIYGQTLSKYIVIDQFGYPPEAKKIAVIRNPVEGFDAAESYTPGNTYSLVDTRGEKVYTAAPTKWSGGNVDTYSGDQAWWFDFSSVTAPGAYYVLDEEKNTRSYEFVIGKAVYNEVLRQAMRTFFYQRVGFAKEAPYADEGWIDGASHLQDKTATLYSDKNNPATARDLHGGWYDAGDYSKYTNWTANYIVMMMLAYIEKPDAWLDNYNIPESGNGVPDLLDEAKWGIDFLLRMQESDGSVLSIVSLDDDNDVSPPSKAKKPSYYGSASTSATLNAAAAYAIASVVFKGIGDNAYAQTLLVASEKAWTWALANPEVKFYNNVESLGTGGVGAGQQEYSSDPEDYAYEISMARLRASCFLFQASGNTRYRDHFDANYNKANLFGWTYAYTFESETQDQLLYYTTIPGATESVANLIRAKYAAAMDKDPNFPKHISKADPYRAYFDNYTWGSNGFKSAQGSMFYNVISYETNPTKEASAYDAALGYVNYLHGVNPLSLVYLSNMYAYGAENSVNEFYHSWFTNNSAKWDRVGVSTYGPAPGFLTGGPNPSYSWDGNFCGNSANKALCGEKQLAPPYGQPAAKSYLDFNTSWPLNSWEVTENSCGYQLRYVRLLSKFVDTSTNCDDNPEDPDCVKVGLVKKVAPDIIIYPNPASGMAYIQNLPAGSYLCSIYTNTGMLIKELQLEQGSNQLDMAGLTQGSYVIRLSDGESSFVKLINIL